MKTLRSQCFVARFVACCLFAMGLSPTCAIAAGPSVAAPERPFSLCTQGESVALESEGYKLLGEARRAVEAILKQHEAGQLQQIKPLELGRAYVLTQQVDRIGARLLIWGEVVGAEFRIEAGQLGNRVWGVIVEYCGVSTALLDKGYPIMLARSRQRSPVLDQVAKLRSQGNIAKAESTLFPAYDEIHVMAALYRPIDRHRAAIGPFEAAAAELAPDAQRYHEQQARKTLEEACAPRLPNWDDFQARLTTAAKSIAEQGLATWDGKQISGPELIVAAFAERRKLEVGSAACIGLYWAIPEGAGRPAAEVLLKDLERFAADFPQALAGIVEADAARVSETDIPDLHAEYIKALAGWQSPAEDVAPPSALSQALNAFAAKSPRLAADVAAYRRATDGILRWRARSADLRARGARKAFDAKLTDLKALDAPPYLAPVETMRGKVLGDAIASRLALHVAVVRPWTAGAGGSLQTGEFAYACPMRQAPWAAELASLKSDLQTDVAAPLTLEVAWAIANAERGDLQEIGGEITNVEVDGLLARLAGCSEENWGALDVKRLAVRTRSNVAKTVVSYRSELKPKWLRGSHLFVQLP